MNSINYAFGKTKAPCKDCPDRKVGCHSVCEKYLEWKQVHDQEVEVVKKERSKETNIILHRCRSHSVGN